MNASNEELCAVVMAAGQGTRMRSRRSKVLHELAGRPLLHYPVLAAVGAGATSVVVVASPANEAAVRACLDSLDVPWEIAIQEQPRGTGDAARSALGQLRRELVLVLNGDVPLLQASDLRPLVEGLGRTGAELALLSCELDDAFGYGRVLRDARDRVIGVVEQRDLSSDAQRAVREVNAGLYLARREFLQASLPALDDDNAQGEYYITDIVAMAAEREAVVAVKGDAAVLQGVNDRAQLAALEAVLFERVAARHRLAGVTVQVGALIEDTVSIAADTVVRSGAVLRGQTRIGSGVLIDCGSVIENSRIDDEAVIKPHCVVVDSVVGPRARVGPFAHMRPESELESDAQIGNFVEMKKSVLRSGAKASHLTYLGDAEVGEKANIGAGTIVCNYDGFNKARTQIGAGAFIGSDSQLIAPVTIGEGAYVGTGTTVTQDVPGDALALSRPSLVIKEGYASQLRARLQAAKAKRG